MRPHDNYTLYLRKAVLRGIWIAMDNSAISGTAPDDHTVAHMRSVQPFAVWYKGFSAAELDAITAYGDQLGHSKATIEGRAGGCL